METIRFTKNEAAARTIAAYCCMYIRSDVSKT